MSRLSLTSLKFANFDCEKLVKLVMKDFFLVLLQRLAGVNYSTSLEYLGRVNEKVVPSPSLLSAEISPP